jgi:hypothetical protein
MVARWVLMSHIMMTRRFVLATTLLGALAAPVLADEAKQAPSEDPHGLSDEQVATVVKAHMPEVQDCWHKLPVKDRASDSSLVLGLSIAAKGDVVDTTIISDAPAETRTCIANVARQWTFPVVDLASDVEYPIKLRALH